MSTLKTHFPAIIAFLLALSFGLSTFGKYGISWDEDDQRELGRQNYRYVFEQDKSLLQFVNRDYGPAIELPLAILEKTLKLTDSRDVFLMRHLCLHLFFLTGVAFAYLLIFKIYRNTWLALAASLLLLTAPHLYSHSFYNSKDIPFLVLNIFCFYRALRFFSQPTLTRSIVFGIVMGLTLNLRVIGFVSFGLFLSFMLVDIMANRKATAITRRSFLMPAGFVMSTFATFFASFPWLWSDPPGHFWAVCASMSKFRWIGDILFKGKMVVSNQLPWDYVATWIGVTTPISHLLIGLSGFFLFIFQMKNYWKSIFSDLKTRMNFIFLVSFLCPLALVWLLRPVLLDGWRHLFFVFPPFIFLGIYAIEMASDSKLKNWIIALTTFGILNSAYFMVKNAPYQHLFFNILVNRGEPEKIRRSFETDYWGLGYRQSLEFVLKNDDRPKIKIAVANYPGKSNLQILKPEQRARIEIAEMQDAHYFITNYRNHPDDYAELENQKWHSFQVGNNAFSTIFKLKNE